MRFKNHFAILIMLIITSTGGCGTYVPQISEFWEPVDVFPSMEANIRERIFCETVDALRHVRKDLTINGQPSIPDSYGVQMQTTLTVEEIGGVNPSLALNNPIPNALANTVSVPQSFALTGAVTASSDATRVDTSYSYYNIARITQKDGNSFCLTNPPNLQGSSPLLTYNLGIEKYLRNAVQGAVVFHSSSLAKGGAGKSAKLDVFSYDVKFIVVTSGSINPTWKLVNVSAGTGSLPLVNAGRTRTHELILTFGPGTDAPTDFALQTHFTGQVVQALQQRTQTLQ